jgi:hypothetical protein
MRDGFPVSVQENASEKKPVKSQQVVIAGCFDGFLRKRHVLNTALPSCPPANLIFHAETGTHATSDFDTRHAFTARADRER